MKYALFLGCTIPVRLNNYEISARKVAETLGIELVDLKGAGCCGSPALWSIDETSALAIAAWNISMAEDSGLDIMALCTGCSEILEKANKKLKENPQLASKINQILKNVKREFKGSIEVKHFIKVLAEDFGIDNIKKFIKKRFKGLKVAVHYGCHLLRPSDILKFDNPENPAVLDKLVEITGAESIYWPLKLWCCGAPILAIDEKISLSMARAKIESAKESEADCIVTVCPFCQIQLDALQPEISRIAGKQYNIPVLLYPQLLGLAMGFTPEELGLDLNKIPADNLLSFLSKV